MHFRCNLGQQLIGSKTNGCFDISPHIGRQPCFNACRQPQGISGLVAHQMAHHLVNRAHRMHGHMAVHLLQNGVVHLHIHLVPRPCEHNVRAHFLGIQHRCAGFHAKSLGLIAGRNAASMLAFQRHNTHRAPTQMGLHLLLHTGKKAVKVDV